MALRASRLATGSSRTNKLGPLRDREREGELGALATRKRVGLLPRIEAELLDPLLGETPVPSRVEISAHAEVLSNREPGVDGVSCATKPTFASCSGPSAGRPPMTENDPSLGVSFPTERWSSVVFPRRSVRPGRRLVPRGPTGCSLGAPTCVRSACRGVLLSSCSTLSTELNDLGDIGAG
jgi:hypothetical protein